MDKKGVTGVIVVIIVLAVVAGVFFISNSFSDGVTGNSIVNAKGCGLVCNNSTDLSDSSNNSTSNSFGV